MKAFLSARHATFFLAPLFVLALSCGEDDPVEPAGSGGGGSNTCVFVDSPVQGLSYSSGAVSGVTSADGGFKWETNAAIQFSIGDILLAAPHDPAVVMSPVMIVDAPDINDPTATNIARFLQTIDDDGDAANGIVITAAGVRTLADAQAQLEDGIRAAYAGTYSGNYCVDDGLGGNQTRGGTWTMTVDQDGNATLRFTGATFFTLEDVLSASGQFDAYDPVVSVFGSFGSDFSGRWYTETQSGSFSESTTCVD